MKLLYENNAVGDVKSPIFADNTWHGVLEGNGEYLSSPAGQNVANFIHFSEDWHQRLYANQQAPPSKDEFNPFLELLQSDRWILEDDDGKRHHVEGPVFI